MASFVYVIQSDRNGRFYTGFSADPERRLGDHNARKVKATKHLAPWNLVYVEECLDETAARRREYQIKSMKSRQYIQSLIDSKIDPF